MKTTDNPSTSYLLESVDVKQRTGVLKFKPASPKNAQWIQIYVSLSAILVSRIAKDKNGGLKRGDTLVGTKFTSTIDSRVYSENPFKLTHFMPTEQSNVPENFELCIVSEKQSILEEIMDIAQQKSIRWKNQTRRNHEWLRYVQATVVKNLKEIGPSVVIITSKGKLVTPLRA